MTELTQASLEAILLDMAHMVTSEGKVIRIRPKVLIIPFGQYKTARKVLYPHKVLKRRKGIRGRIYTLKWRRKNAGLFQYLG